MRQAHDERRQREQAEQEFKALLCAVCYPMRYACRTRWIRWDASAFGISGEESEMQAAEKLLDLWSAVAVALRELGWAKAWASVNVEEVLRSARVLGNFEKADTLCARDVVKAGAYVLGELLGKEPDPATRARVLGYLTELRRMELRGEAPRVFECLGLYLDAVRCAIERSERASNGAPVQQRRGRVLPLPKDALREVGPSLRVPSLKGSFHDRPDTSMPTFVLSMERSPEGNPVHCKLVGKTRCRLAQLVIEQPGQDHKWRDLLKTGLERGFWRITSADTLRRQGSRIREKLDPCLRGYWQQDTQGVRWALNATILPSPPG